MKRISVLIGVVALLALGITGCAGNRDAIAKASLNSRQDVFQQTQSIQPLAGKALLNVEFPVKTYKSYFINTYTKHENPPYTVTINIDGQVAVVSAEPVLENLPGDFRETPEVGTGWKYEFKETFILQPGTHHIIVAVPLSDALVEKTVVLKEGANSLQLAPVYNSPVSKYSRYPRFSKGLKSIAVKLNSQEL